VRPGLSVGPDTPSQANRLVMRELFECLHRGFNDVTRARYSNWVRANLPDAPGLQRARPCKPHAFRGSSRPRSHPVMVRINMLAVAESFQVVDTISEPAQRMRRDFRVLPGLALTFAQARRLWALHENACRESLDTLVAEGFLCVRSDARYVRREGCRRPG
jgi:hypothetical protein